MLYNRQKELLYLVSEMKQLEELELQQLEFMACIESDKPSYEFIPYQHGPYSITLQHDLDYLCRENLLLCSEDQYSRTGEPVPPFPAARKVTLDEALSKFGGLSSRELMRMIYVQYPQFAVNSLNASELLSEQELLQVKNHVPHFDTSSLFTIGYQGKSLEKYLLLLFENGIKLLVDIRANSHSMKKEFIGTHLEIASKLLNIDYLHVPELGIPRNYRKDIPDRKDLFRTYRDELLPQKTEEIKRLGALLQERGRMALTCYEADFNDCHRHFLSEKLINYVGNKTPLKHI